VVFTDRPELRFFNLLYLLPLPAIVIAVIIFFLPDGIIADPIVENGVKSAAGLSSAGVGLVLLLVILYYQLSLKCARYTVTDSHIESQTGVLNKSTRRIPFNFVNDVTVKQNLFQSLAGTHSITVTTSNGDSVVLENVTEGQRKQEIIWELVRGEAPDESHVAVNPASSHDTQ